jgi:hypothetical protein
MFLLFVVKMEVTKYDLEEQELEMERSFLQEVCLHDNQSELLSQMQILF